MIGKYYFCIVRDKVKAIDSLKLKQTFISINKISPECKKSVFDYKPFKKYIKMKMALVNNKLIISELK